MNTNQTVNFFWHGPKLGPVQVACIRSFMRHGHRAVLHCYTPPEDIPEGVALFDARQIMSLTDLISNTETGSVALGTNRYRYRMIKAGHGTYADCDMFLLRPLPPDDILIGLQNSVDKSHACNNALLRYPPASRLAFELVKATMKEQATMPWRRRRRQVLNSVLRPLGLAPSVRNAPWGEWGPALVSYWVKELGLVSLCKPIDVFYPVHYFGTDLLFDPGLKLDDLITPRSVAVHLCHRMSGGMVVPSGCPLDQIIQS